MYTLEEVKAAQEKEKILSAFKVFTKLEDIKTGKILMWDEMRKKLEYSLNTIDEKEKFIELKIEEIKKLKSQLKASQEQPKEELEGGGDWRKYFVRGYNEALTSHTKQGEFSKNDLDYVLNRCEKWWRHEQQTTAWFDVCTEILQYINYSSLTPQSYQPEVGREVTIDFNHWVAKSGFRLIESGNVYYWRSEKLDKNIKDGNELYLFYEEEKRKRIEVMNA